MNLENLLKGNPLKQVDDQVWNQGWNQVSDQVWNQVLKDVNYGSS